MLPQKRPREKVSTECGLKGTAMKAPQYTAAPPYDFTSDAWLQLQRWEIAGQSRLRERGKLRTHCKSHCKLNWSPWDLAGKSSFVILLRVTMAREPWHDFYLRKKGQCFIQVLLELEHLNDTGSLLFQVANCHLCWLKETKDLWQISSAVFGRHVSLTLDIIVLKAAVVNKGYELSLLLFSI